jgi:DNA-binding MarR family transcriptional regulator
MARELSADLVSAEHRAEHRAELDEELVSGLRMGVMRLARRLRLERSGNDLTLTQLATLGTLHRDGPQTIGDLASAENVKPPSMTRTVNCLQELGLVTREPHQGDRRQVVVVLTAKAEAVVIEDRRRRDAWLKSHLADLTDSERQLLRRVAPLLNRLAQQ